MAHVISTKTPHLVSHLLRTNHTPSYQTSRLLFLPAASASTNFRTTLQRSFFGHTTFTSSRQRMSSLAEREHFPRPSHSSSRDPDLDVDTGLDPYKYTGGRWLRRDALERESRLIQFDFDALCRKVIELCPGASSIASYDKKEGGFNRVFIFQTDNEKRIAARLPFALAGPSRLTTNSEVATIKYCTFT